MGAPECLKMYKLFEVSPEKQLYQKYSSIFEVKITLISARVTIVSNQFLFLFQIGASWPSKCSVDLSQGETWSSKSRFGVFPSFSYVLM
jgi:hypothetical protein